MVEIQKCFFDEHPISNNVERQKFDAFRRASQYFYVFELFQHRNCPLGGPYALLLADSTTSCENN